jgi:hypothetical protein
MWYAGEMVAKKAQRSEIPKTISVCCHGKKKWSGIPVNRTLCNNIVQPTIVPMIIPMKLAENTIMKHS